ncbi:MAG: DNA-directed RNA polymerase subunit omega [Lachnospiraceae bacterium]|nr:DNA-directed RNA polymerase subunit omega [Lachnospiraceae bacterium]
MIHPSYTEIMKVVNSEVEPGDEPVVNSRYSIVLATAKRARQLIDGAEPLCEGPCNKPLSTAVEEVYEGKVKIVGDEEEAAREEAEKIENAVKEASMSDMVLADEAAQDEE